MANFMIELENKVKGSVTGNLVKTSDVDNAAKVIVREAVSNFINESEDIIPAGLQIPAAIVRGAMIGINETGIDNMQAISSLVNGAVQGFVQAGGTQADVIKGSVDQAIKSAAHIELHVAGIAVESVKGVIEAIKELNGNLEEARRDAVLTVWNSAANLSDDHRQEVKDSLINNIAGAKEIIK